MALGCSSENGRNDMASQRHPRMSGNMLVCLLTPAGHGPWELQTIPQSQQQPDVWSLMNVCFRCILRHDLSDLPFLPPSFFLIALGWKYHGFRSNLAVLYSRHYQKVPSVICLLAFTPLRQYLLSLSFMQMQEYLLRQPLPDNRRKLQYSNQTDLYFTSFKMYIFHILTSLKFAWVSQLLV